MDKINHAGWFGLRVSGMKFSYAGQFTSILSQGRFSPKHIRMGDV